MKFESWQHFFEQEKGTLYFQNILRYVENARKSTNVFPSREQVFYAFDRTDLKTTKVVILGQDPYHQQGQAMGLAFSVNPLIKLPPSLVNIYKEIENDTGAKMDFANGDLSYLSKQGVLLFNPIFTVEENHPLSHDIPEYKQLTTRIFEVLSSLEQPLVYILWGTKAQKWEKYIKNKNALVIKTNHPSPLSANRGGFFGKQTFSKTNQYLLDHGLLPIRWHNL